MSKSFDHNSSVFRVNFFLSVCVVFVCLRVSWDPDGKKPCFNSFCFWGRGIHGFVISLLVSTSNVFLLLFRMK